MSSLQPEPKAAPTPLPKPSFTPAQGGLLQRKCACGGPSGLAGDCKECSEKQFTLQRYSTDRAQPSSLLRALAEVSNPGPRTGLLQRKCACGGSPALDGECEECNSKRLTLQRSSVHRLDTFIPTRTP